MRPPAGGFHFHKVGNPWFSWHYITSNSHVIWVTTKQHLTLTVLSVALGFAVAIPMAVLARRAAPLRAAVLGLCSAVYAVPSLAFIVAMYKIFGLSRLTVVIPLAAYTLVILVRNILTGLDEVSPEALDAARGLGFSDRRILLRVRLPLAVPAIMAGLRIATVSTIELVVIGGFAGQDGYGSKILEGFRNNFYHPEIMTYLLLSIVVALIADLLLLAVQRLITPWRTEGAR
jgi:osmoprotectant transport system permease protein